MADVNVNVTRQVVATGWGRATWGEGAWNESITFPDISMVGAVGSTFTNADANVSGLSGISALKFLGDEELRTNNNISVTGFGLTATIGVTSQRLVNRIDVTGISANGRLDNVNLSGDANVSITGVSTTANLGNELVWGEINTNQTPNWQTIKEAA